MSASVVDQLLTEMRGDEADQDLVQHHLVQQLVRILWHKLAWRKEAGSW